MTIISKPYSHTGRENYAAINWDRKLRGNRNDYNKGMRVAADIIREQHNRKEGNVRDQLNVLPL